MRQSPSQFRPRSQSSVMGVILMTAVTLVVGVVLITLGLGFSEQLNDPQPELSVEASFDARADLDPHWTFSIRHVSGDNIEPGELEFRLVDQYDSEAAATYPEAFTAGDTIRMGLWGSPNRASKTGVDCTLDPEDPPGATNDQLVDVDPPAETVEVVVVHKPTNSLLDRVEVDLGEYPDRFGTRLLDGSKASFDCNDVEWQSGTVVEAD